MTLLNLKIEFRLHIKSLNTIYYFRSLNLNYKIKFIFKYSNNWNFEYLENDINCYPKSFDLIDKLYTLLK